MSLGIADPPHALRQRVAQTLTKEETELAASISDETVHVRWADDIDIRALVRSYADVCLIILDQSTNMVNAVMNDPLRIRTAVLVRSDNHYRPLLVDSEVKKSLRERVGTLMGVSIDVSRLLSVVEPVESPMRSALHTFILGFLGGMCVASVAHQGRLR